jgi:SNF2 family DNA or RNA helicase
MDNKKYIYKTTPYEHQRNALIKGAKELNFAYFLEMGTGKTKVAIDNVAYLYQEKLINTAIVIAPNSVYKNWIKEIETHSPISDYTMFIWKDDVKINYQIDKLNYVLMNIEALSHKSGFEFLLKLVINTGQKAMMIIDESTTIKNDKAKRSKNICKLSPHVKYKRILTGSPVTKSPLDLYQQCAFLSKDLLGYPSFVAFRARYAVMKQINMGPNRVILIPQYYTNLDELEAKIKKFSFRVRKVDCLDLPEKIYQQRYVNLTKEQIKVYEELRKYARSVIEDKEVSFANKLTEILKLHQVCNGYLKTDDGEIVPFDNDPKLEELLSIIEESDGKFIIWANYIHNIKTIVKTLRKEYGDESVVSIYGEITTENRKKAVEEFQGNDKVRFFVGNPSTGGYGLTLTAASYVVYYSNNYNLEIREQSEDRAHRIGQTKSVTYIDLIIDKTIDSHIISALKRKIKISAETMGEEIKNWI